MGSQYSTGKHAIAECDRCGFRYKLKQLKSLVIKTKNVNILVCPECWEPDQPQLSLGLYPVNDPQAVHNPRPDVSYYEEGNNGAGGSRVFQWGWNPVGGAKSFDSGLTPNDLVGTGRVGTVTVWGNNAVYLPPSINITSSNSGDYAASVFQTTGDTNWIGSVRVGTTYVNVYNQVWLNYYTNSTDYEFLWAVPSSQAYLILGNINTWETIPYYNLQVNSTLAPFYLNGTVTVSGTLYIRRASTSTILASSFLVLTATYIA